MNKKKPLFSIADTPCQLLDHPLFDHQQIQVWIKREDLNDAEIQGNKLYKLRLNLESAKQQQKTLLMSFGGAYSNHIAALAAAGKRFNIPTLGFIRGQELAEQPQKWSHTLLQAQQNGMELKFLDRQSYRQKHRPEFLFALKQQYPNAYLIPEGGTNPLAIAGLQPLAESIDRQCPNWTHLFTPVGTGGTLTGLIEHTHFGTGKQILGVATLKQADYLLADIKSLLSAEKKCNSWQLLNQYHQGGYAKTSPELNHITDWFEKTFNLMLDPIYTNKMIFAFIQELHAGNIPPGAKVVLLHTGGLQGRNIRTE